MRCGRIVVFLPVGARVVGEAAAVQVTCLNTRNRFRRGRGPSRGLSSGECRRVRGPGTWGPPTLSSATRRAVVFSRTADLLGAGRPASPVRAYEPRIEDSQRATRRMDSCWRSDAGDRGECDDARPRLPKRVRIIAWHVVLVIDEDVTSPGRGLYRASPVGSRRARSLSRMPNLAPEVPHAQPQGRDFHASRQSPHPRQTAAWASG